MNEILTVTGHFLRTLPQLLISLRFPLAVHSARTALPPAPFMWLALALVAPSAFLPAPGIASPQLKPSLSVDRPAATQRADVHLRFGYGGRWGGRRPWDGPWGGRRDIWDGPGGSYGAGDELGSIGAFVIFSTCACAALTFALPFFFFAAVVGVVIALSLATNWNDYEVVYDEWTQPTPRNLGEARRWEREAEEGPFYRPYDW